MSERRRLRAALAPGIGMAAADVEIPDWVRHFRRSEWAARVPVEGLMTELDGPGRAVLAKAKARQVWCRDVVLWCIEHDADPTPFLRNGGPGRSSQDDGTGSYAPQWDALRREYDGGARAEGPAGPPVVSEPAATQADAPRRKGKG